MLAPRPHAPALHNVMHFWKAWLRRPTRVGAVTPSSRSLAAAMADGVGRRSEGTVVELGGGTGSITAALLQSGVAPSNLVVIERDPALCEIIAMRFPRIRVICGDARDLSLLLRRAGIERIGAVVSGLPMIMLPPEVCRSIVAQSFAVMAEDGVFVQFTYGPVSPLSRATMRALGLEGDRSEWVLGNLPPAAVWHYRRRQIRTRTGVLQTGGRAA